MPAAANNKADGEITMESTDAPEGGEDSEDNDKVVEVRDSQEPPPPQQETTPKQINVAA